MKLFILEDDGRTPLQVDDVLAWGWWFGLDNRIVKQDRDGNVLVSTVFLGIDHRHWGEGPPILWETLVFGGEHDQEMKRYSSYEEAVEGHNEMVRRVLGRASV